MTFNRKKHIQHTLVRWLYSLLLFLLLPLLLLVFKKKLGDPKPILAKRKFSERFGFVNKNFKPGGVHIHCVSVGELNAAQGLINTILKEYPSLPITLTTSSTTGAVHAYSLFKDRVQHCYLPIDLALFMWLFYKRIKASLVLVTEVEVWPNMLHQCAKRNIPAVLINARMTTKSLLKYKRYSWLFRNTYRQFDAICAQSSDSFENFIAFGIYKKHLHLSRNMKFDLLPEHQDEVRGQQFLQNYKLQGRPILLAGSTHEPEEKLLLNTFNKLKQQYPDLALVVVPRHPHRFDDAYQIIKASGWSTVRVSEGPSELGANNTIDCVVVDTMGWLKACYSICTVAFVGGSFANKGGHNALEAALYSKPIVMGTSVFNNPVICHHLANQKALKIVANETTLYTAIEQWLGNPEQALSEGEKGLQVLLKNAGSVEYTLGILRNYLPAASHS